MRIDEGRKGWNLPSIKMKAGTVVGRGEKSLIGDPGPELRLGREKGKEEKPTVRFGAVLSNRESYGEARCGFRILYILRCDSVLFSEIRNPTMRCGSLLKRANILRCDSVRLTEKLHRIAPNR